MNKEKINSYICEHADKILLIGIVIIGLLSLLTSSPTLFLLFGGAIYIVSIIIMILIYMRSLIKKRNENIPYKTYYQIKRINGEKEDVIKEFEEQRKAESHMLDDPEYYKEEYKLFKICVFKSKSGDRTEAVEIDMNTTINEHLKQYYMPEFM